MRKMIITGVTSGIGKALVEKYDGKYLPKYKDLIFELDKEEEG